MSRPEAGQRHHHRRRRAGACVHRRRRREEEHLRRPGHPVQLAPWQARLRQLPPRLQPGPAPRERHPGVAADGQVQRLRRLPRRRDPDVPGVVPRQPGVHQGCGQGAAVRRLPRRAQHRHAGDRRVPQSADGVVHPVPRGRGRDVPRQLPRQGLPARLRARRPCCSDCHGGHRILPASVPESTVSSENVVETCARCHAGANRTSPSSGRTSIRRTRPPRRQNLVLLDRLRAAHRRRVHLLGRPPQPVHLPRGRRRPVLTSAPPRPKGRHASRVPALQRSHRWMHFLVIVSFTVLVFTGMPLKYKDTAWAQWFMDLFGGVTAAGIYHRLAAIVTVVYWTAEMLFMVVMVVRAAARTSRPRLHDVGKKDLEDVVGMFAWFFGKGPKPQFDRYTYWEKFDYISLTVGTVIIGLTGFMMWFPLRRPNTCRASSSTSPRHPLQRSPSRDGRHLHLRALLQRSPAAGVVPHRQGHLHRHAARRPLP